MIIFWVKHSFKLGRGPSELSLHPVSAQLCLLHCHSFANSHTSVLNPNEVAAKGKSCAVCSGLQR